MDQCLGTQQVCRSSSSILLWFYHKWWFFIYKANWDQDSLFHLSYFLQLMTITSSSVNTVAALMKK